MDENRFKEITKRIINKLIIDKKKGDAKKHLYKYLKKNIEYFRNPDTINIVIIDDIKNIIELFVIQAYNHCVSGNDLYKIIVIFIEYKFFENNIEELIINNEGTPFSADKCRYIINYYLNYRITGKKPGEANGYHVPKIGTMENWFNFVDSLTELYYGKSEKYMDMYNLLRSKA